MLQAPPQKWHTSTSLFTLCHFKSLMDYVDVLVPDIHGQITLPFKVCGSQWILDILSAFG